jgi:hypothetical protein
MQINCIAENIDKSSASYKRRLEALKSAPVIILEMFSRVLAQGVTASCVLMESLFTYVPLIQVITKQGLDLIGMWFAIRISDICSANALYH